MRRRRDTHTNQWAILLTLREKKERNDRITHTHTHTHQNSGKKTIRFNTYVTVYWHYANIEKENNRSFKFLLV
jgi:hypothetical protein